MVQSLLWRLPFTGRPLRQPVCVGGGGGGRRASVQHLLRAKCEPVPRVEIPARHWSGTDKLHGNRAAAAGRTRAPG